MRVIGQGSMRLRRRSRWRATGWRQPRTSGCDWSYCAKRLKLPNRVTEGSADGTISRTCWTPHRLGGAVRQLANVTGLPGKAGKPFIRSGIIRSGVERVERDWLFAAKPDTSRARDDRDRGVHEAAPYRDRRARVAKAVNFSRTY